MKKVSICALSLLSAMALVACGGGSSSASGSNSSSSQSDSLTDVSILFTGWVNSPTDSKDPFKQYVKDNYGINMNLMATNDFSSDVVVKFASNNKPDIVVFEDMNSFRKMMDQGVLIDDWSQYLETMPDMQKVINNGSTDENPSVAKRIFTTDDGKLQTLWFKEDPPTWSLKIREDWAKEFRKSDPAYANWDAKTPDDLLNFARWIKKNKQGCYGFTSAGNRSSFGTLGNYLSYMFGYVNELPWGIYVDDNNEASFGTVDGSYKKYLDYVKTIVDEGLIDPTWYEQDWDHKTKTKEGKIGIEWYPGTISQETEEYQKDNLAEGETTLDWWETYDLPSDGGKHSGYMPIDSYYGNLVTVSKKASIDKVKMKKICSLLNDVTFSTEDDGNGGITFNRGKAYDALRWGVGVEKGLAFQDIPNTNYKYICTSDSSKSFYRDTSAGQGAWDWGAWFSNTGDGVIQGNSKTVSDVTLKVYEHNLKTSLMKTQVQVGSSLNLDATAVKDTQSRMENYAYKYVTGQSTGFGTYDDFENAWKTTWGGNNLLSEAKIQFQDIGFIK